MFLKKARSSNFSNNAVPNMELTDYFSHKFSSDIVLTDQMLQAVRVAKEKYEHLCKNAYHSSVVISEVKSRYMTCLKYGTAAGHDGITTEHLRFALNAKLPLYLSHLLTVCLQFGEVPDTF